MATKTDNFNRANNVALGTSSEGWSWTEVSGNTDLFNNQAEANSGGSNRAETDLDSADHYAQIDMVGGFEGTRIGGPMVRYSASAETAYYAILYAGDNKMYIGKLVAGSETHLGNAAGGPSIPNTLKCEINGTALKGYVNGAEIVGVTDSSISSNTRTGFRLSGGIQMDNFQAEDLGGGEAGDAVPQVWAQYRRRMAA